MQKTHSSNVDKMTKIPQRISVLRSLINTNKTYCHLVWGFCVVWTVDVLLCLYKQLYVSYTASYCDNK